MEGDRRQRKAVEGGGAFTLSFLSPKPIEAETPSAKVNVESSAQCRRAAMGPSVRGTSSVELEGVTPRTERAITPTMPRLDSRKAARASAPS